MFLLLAVAFLSAGSSRRAGTNLYLDQSSPGISATARQANGDKAGNLVFRLNPSAALTHWYMAVFAGEKTSASQAAWINAAQR
jgi:hypothetical protein